VPQERLTKDQRREQARELARKQRDKRLRDQKRNKILVRVGATVGVIALLGAIGGGIWLATRPAGPGPVNMASDGIVLTGSEGVITAVENDGLAAADDDPVETDTSKFDAPAHIVAYVDYGCPFCGDFETGNGELMKQLVSAGEATLEVHPIAILDSQFLGSEYPTRAANAAACVAALEPNSFFDVNAAFFAQQPAEGTRGLTNAEIIDLVEGAGVSSDEVTACINEGRYKAWVEIATDRTITNPNLVNPANGRFGTPTVFVNGVRYQPASLSDPNEFLAFIAANADLPDSDEGTDPAPSTE